MLRSADTSIAFDETRVVLDTVASMHDAEDADALVGTLLTHLDELIGFEAADWVLQGDRPGHGNAAGAATSMTHRLAIRGGSSALLLGLVLGRRTRPFDRHEATIAALLQPHVASALDHVRLRQRMLAEQSPAGLTAREREVLALVADGRTNRAIGQALFIEPRTVEKHVEHIRAKLGARTRAAAAAQWARAAAGG